MSRFRPSPEAEQALRSVDGLDDGDLEWDAADTTGLADWLSMQQVGTVRVRDVGVFVDVELPELLTRLDKHPRVRDAVSALDAAARLDVAIVRLGGVRLGRPISQALGVAIREWIPDALGVGYRSRFASDEPCWAIWHTTTVDVRTTLLSATDPHHREAVRAVASAFEIALPPAW